MQLVKHPSDKELVRFAREFSARNHSSQPRRSGENHFDHVQAVVRDGMRVILPSSHYCAAFEAALYSHDTAEDVKGIDVFNPYSPPLVFDDSITYLNDVFAPAGKRGEHACYIIDRFTNRDPDYNRYMFKKFSFSPPGENRDLDALTLIGKLADRKHNSTPHEKILCGSVLDKYRQLDIMSECMETEERNALLLEFYEKHKVSWAFTDAEWGIAPHRLERAVRMNYKRRKIRNAHLNCAFYVPIAEDRLGLIGESDGSFDHLFDREKCRDLLKGLVANSLEVLLETKVLNEDSIFAFQNITNGNGPYKPVFLEVYEEITQTGKIPYEKYN